MLLQDNVVSGLLFFLVVGMAAFNIGRPEILYFSFASAVLSMFFAWCFRYPDDEIKDGIWGYNAVLYGIACGMAVSVSVSGITILIIGTLGIVLFTPLLSSMLRGLPVLIAPFVIATWLLYSVIKPHEISTPSGEDSFSALLKNYLGAFSGNFMEVFMFSDVVGGILVILGLLAGNRNILVISIVTSILCTGASFCIPELSLDKISDGVYGCNAILTAIAVYMFAGDNKYINIILGGGAIMLAFIIPVLISSLISFPILTFPFVICSWGYILAQRLYMPAHA